MNRQPTGSSDEVIAVVPARGGSKGLPGKNLRELAGVPLVAHAIRQAAAARTVDRVVVTTDSPEIAEVARREGAEVPFLRPAELATDTATDLEVFQHLLDFLVERERRVPALLVQVRPTSPIRRPQVIDLAVRKIIAHRDATSLRSVSPVDFPPYKTWLIDAESQLTPVARVPGLRDWYDQPRQALPQAYAQDGLVDVIRPHTILDGASMAGSTILGLLHPEPAVDIDVLKDLQHAEQLVACRGARPPGERSIGIIQGRLTVSQTGQLQCFPSGRWAEEFATAQKLGFDAIEVIAAADATDNPLLTDEGATRLAEVSRRSGVAVRAACIDQAIGHDVRGSDTGAWLHALIPRLAKVGVTTAVLPLFGASDVSEDGARGTMAVTLLRLADDLGRAGIRLCLESALNGSDLYEYLGVLAHENIGVCYDLGNTTALGHDTVIDVSLLAPLVWHVHVKDKDFDGRSVLLGTGSAKLPELLGELSTLDCSLSLETPRGDDPAATARAHLTLVRRLTAAAAS